MSTLALGLLIILVMATGTFYVAGLQVGHGAAWATDVCYRAGRFCDHPEWTGIAAAVTFVIYFILRRIED